MIGLLNPDSPEIQYALLAYFAVYLYVCIGHGIFHRVARFVFIPISF